MIVINSTIITVGPLSIAMPVPEGGRENAWGKFPVMARGVDQDGNLQMTGYLPATTLRGFLRREAVLRDMEAAAAADKHYNLKRAYSELIGQDADSEKSGEEIDLLAIKKAREESPVLDLFGSGLGIKSRLSVSNFLPTVNVLPQPMSGVRKDLDDTEGALELVEKGDRQRFYGRSDANSARARAATLVSTLEKKIRAAKKNTAEDVAELEKERAAAQALVDKYELEMGEMKNSSKTLLTWWALPAGLTLNGRLVVERDRPRDIELLMRGLDALSRNPVLGAYRARGCGEISGTFDFLRDGALQKRVTVGDYMPAQVVDFAS
jgi:hypothetical protein